MMGLAPQRETGIVMLGGHGSKAMLDVARRLVVEFSRDIPLLHAAGRLLHRHPQSSH